MIVKGLPGQSVFDIALKHYGSLEGIRFLMEDNEYSGQNIVNIVNLDGKDISIRKGVVLNKRVADYFQNRTIVTR